MPSDVSRNSADVPHSLHRCPIWFAKGLLREPRCVRHHKPRQHGSARLRRQCGNALPPVDGACWRIRILQHCDGVQPASGAAERRSRRLARAANASRIASCTASTSSSPWRTSVRDGDRALVVQAPQLPGGRGSHLRVTVAPEHSANAAAHPGQPARGVSAPPAVAGRSRSCSTTPAYRRR